MVELMHDLHKLIWFRAVRKRIASVLSFSRSVWVVEGGGKTMYTDVKQKVANQPSKF